MISRPVVLFSSLLLVLSVLLNDSRRAAPPAPWIAFTSDRDGNWELYRMRIDGGDVRRLTFNRGPDDWPAWSPDGRWVAFRSTRFGDQQIYRIRPDGTQVATLSALPQVGAPTWSPDGQWIAFPAQQRNRDGVYLMRADGTELHWLTVRPRGVLAYSWLGETEWLLVQTIFHNNAEIFRVHRSRSVAINLTDNPSHDQAAVSSPDGQWIAFLSDRDGNLALYVMRPDGHGLRRLNNASNRPPLWSPDSQWLFFLWVEEEVAGLYRIRPDGSDRHRVAAGRGDESFMTIAPDGRWLAFVVNRQGFDNVHLLNLETGTRRQLTYQGNNLSPSWGPVVALPWHGSHLMWAAVGGCIAGMLPARQRYRA